MKKIVLLILITVISVFSQTDLVEGFENGEIPAGWTVLDLDGNNSTDMGIGVESMGYWSHNGVGLALCQSSYNPDDPTETLLTDNWLVTPQVELGENNILNFWLDSFFEDRLASVNILLSTTGNNADDFTINLGTIEEVPYAFDANYGYTYTLYEYDLSSYSGQSVYIAFQATWETDGNNIIYLGIDDISISEQTAVYPTVEITSHEFGDQVYAHEIVEITAEATDADSVEFYLQYGYNSLLHLGTDYEAPFTAEWDTEEWEVGFYYYLIAKAKNSNGEAESIIENLSLYDIIPNCELVLPNSGTTNLIGEEITLLATTFDSDTITGGVKNSRSISSVSFYANEQLIGTVTTEPYTLEWNTAEFDEGLYYIKAISTDEDGNEGESSSSMVTLASSSFSENMLWSDIYGDYGTDGGFDVCKTYDGNYIVSGFTTTGSFLVKYDLDGNILWEKTFVEENHTSMLFNLKKINDEDGYIATGSKDENIWLVKFDLAGDIIWEKIIGESFNNSRGLDVINSSDNGFVISGYKESSNNKDFYVLKTDNSGNLLWDYSIGSANYDEAASVTENSTGDFVIVGYKERTYQGSQLGDYGKIVIVKLDNDGNELWNKTISENEDNVGYSIVESSSDDGYLISGHVSNQNGNHTESGGYIVFIDEDGDMVWDKIMNNGNADFYDRSFIKSIEQLPSGEFLLGGGKFHDYNNTNSWTYSFWLKIVDNLGNNSFEETFGFGNTDIIEDVKYSNDKIFFTGYTFSLGEFYSTPLASQCDMISGVISYSDTDIEGNYELGITNYELKQNYPNPFNPVTKINYELAITDYKSAKIVVYNAMGQMVWNSKPLILNSNHCLFDGSLFNSGIYYYSLVIDGKKMDTKSMVLIK